MHTGHRRSRKGIVNLQLLIRRQMNVRALFTSCWQKNQVQMRCERGMLFLIPQEWIKPVHNAYFAR